MRRPFLREICDFFAFAASKSALSDNDCAIMKTAKRETYVLPQKSSGDENNEWRKK